MEKAEISNRVNELVSKQLRVESAVVAADQSFIEDLGADSLDIVELMMAMELEFGFEMSETEAEGIRTVGDAVNYVGSQLNGS